MAALGRRIFTIGDRARRTHITSLCPQMRMSSAARLTTQPEHIIKSPFDDVHIPDMNFSEYILDDFGKRAHLNAMVDGITGETVTYGELQTMIWKSASALYKLGIRSGDVVTLLSENRIEYAVIFLACQSLGAIVCTINNAYVKRELMFSMKHSNAVFCIASESCIQVAKDALKEIGLPKDRLLVLGREDGIRSFKDLLEDDGSAFPSNGTPDRTEQSSILHKDSCVLPYSSGTTGMPKGVMLSHNNIISNIQQLLNPAIMEYKEGEDRILGVLPWYHIYGQVVVMLASLKAGACLITMPKFTPESYLQVTSQYKPTYLHIVPPIILFMEKSPLLGDASMFESVERVVTAAAPVGADTMEKMSKRCGINILQQSYYEIIQIQGLQVQVYGLTETSPLTHANPHYEARNDTCGLPISNTEYKIVSIEDGKTVARKEEGEICVRGPQVMLGYLDNEKATNDMIDSEGWLRTGDIGYADLDGHMVITDRIKELIKFKGHQVAPAELESLLVQHPDVSDAAVIGIPDDRAGEIPRAYVVLKPNTSITDHKLMEIINEQVAPHKKLRGGIEFRDSIPKTTSGKILRKQLRAELEQ